MVLLSRVIGRLVTGFDGDVVGRLIDLTVRLGKHIGPPLAERLLVRRTSASDLFLPWSSVANISDSGVVLCPGHDPTTFAITSISDALADDEILLGRDALDTQVVDVAGQRLARVADIVLQHDDDGRLELVGVDVGFGAVLRRLGPRRAAPNENRDLIAWTDLHLTSERGHAIQLSTPRSAVHHTNALELAALLSRLDVDSATDVLAVRSPDVAAEAVRTAHPIVAERVLRAMPVADTTKILDAMPVEHAKRWRDRLAHPPVLGGRRFRRFRVWPRHRHPAADRGVGGAAS